MGYREVGELYSHIFPLKEINKHDIEKETELHIQILTYCKTSRYLERMSNMHNRTHTHTHTLTDVNEI